MFRVISCKFNSWVAAIKSFKKYFKSASEKFDKYDNALNLINKIKNGKMCLADVKNLGEIKKGSNKKWSKEQKNALYNTELL